MGRRMKYCYAYGDEGGETGHKFEAGSTSFFTATLVLTNQSEMLRDFVQEFKTLHHLSTTQKLSFRRTPDNNRLAFLKALARFDVQIRALRIDKRFSPPEVKRLSKMDFYVLAFSELIHRSADDLQEAEVVLDEMGNPQKTLRALKLSLHHRFSGNDYHRFVRRLNMRASQRDPLLQLADMVNGAIYRCVWEEDDRFYRLIEEKTILWLK